MVLGLQWWNKIFFSLAIFCLPFQLGKELFSVDWGRGFLNPFLSISLSLSEVFIFLAGALFLVQILLKRHALRLGAESIFTQFLLFLSLLVLSLFTTPHHDPQFHLLLLSKVFIGLLFYILTVNKILKSTEILAVLFATLGFQAGLSLVQLFTQSSLGFSLLGEPFISAESAHLSRFTVFGHTFIRSYGTFPHPNILAAYLSLGLIGLNFLPDSNKVKIPLLFLFAIALLGTFSRIAILVSFIAYGILKFSKIPKKITAIFLIAIVSVLVLRGLNLDQESLTLRIQDFSNAAELFTVHPFGLGFHHYTLFLDEIGSQHLNPWSYQPAHNTFLLFGIETGLLGFIALIYWAYSILKYFLQWKGFSPKAKILGMLSGTLLTLALFDHFFLSLNQGFYLLILLVAFNARFFNDPDHMFNFQEGNWVSIKSLLPKIKSFASKVFRPSSWS